WVAHAYASDASTLGRTTLVADPSRHGFPPGSLDWEEYFGALEEISYRGFLTIWPDPNRDPGPQFSALSTSLSRL
ncbi:sugar phosphate isomerase/epimerase family protein, partial [Singulisphaera rosea]